MTFRLCRGWPAENARRWSERSRSERPPRFSTLNLLVSGGRLGEGLRGGMWEGGLDWGSIQGLAVFAPSSFGIIFTLDRASNQPWVRFLVYINIARQVRDVSAPVLSPLVPLDCVSFFPCAGSLVWLSATFFRYSILCFCVRVLFFFTQFVPLHSLLYKVRGING